MAKYNRLVYDDGMPSYDEVRVDEHDGPDTMGLAVEGDPLRERLQYLEFIRDVVFGSQPTLEVAKARKFPDYGLIQRDQIDSLIRTAQIDIERRDNPERVLVSMDPSYPKSIGWWFKHRNGTLQRLPANPDDLIGQQLHINLGNYAQADIEATMAMYNKIEEDNMSNDPEFLRREAQRMLERAEILESMPKEDTFDVGQVITFTRVLSGKEYKYAAIKLDIGNDQHRWYVTGEKAASGVYWNELMDFIRVGNLRSIEVLDMSAKVNIVDYVKGVQKVLEGETSAPN